MLKDKVVIITGASRGLGKALALACAKKGAKVVVSARTEKNIKEIAEQIKGLSVKADVTKEEQIKKLSEIAFKHFGKIDVWINNAGIWLPGSPVEKLDMRRVRELFEVNVFGTIHGSKQALLKMKGKGTIINIISSSALSGRAEISGYATSKWATRGFTECLQEETKESGIKVIAVYPGGMKTNLFDENRPKDFSDYMDQDTIALKIVENLELPNPIETLILKRPVK